MSTAFPKSATVERVLRGQLCSGCGACAAISDGAIAMQVVSPGYLRPVQSQPIQSGTEQIIAAACPGATLAPWGDALEINPLWGPAVEVATGHATDNVLRHTASSGAMISALAIQALESGIVDAIVHTHADPDNPIATLTAISDTRAKVVAGAGSRYAPSSPLAGLGALLDDPRRFAFIGKPCDVSALRQWAAKDARVAARFPIMVSFFCGGIPSHRGTEAILEDLDVKREELAEFRYRGDGWPGFATAVRKDGTSARMSYAKSWGDRLSKHVQFRCKICPDAVGGVADLVCADAWYGDERGYPSFEEAEGRSLVIARTATGKALLNAARDANAVTTEPCPITEIDLMQPSQARRKRLARSRLAAMAFWLHPRPDASGALVRRAARQASLVEAAKSFLGLLRRIASKAY